MCNNCSTPLKLRLFFKILLLSTDYSKWVSAYHLCCDVAIDFWISVFYTWFFSDIRQRKTEDDRHYPSRSETPVSKWNVQFSLLNRWIQVGTFKVTSLVMAEVVVRRDSEDILCNKGKSKTEQYRTKSIFCSDRAATTPEQNIHEKSTYCVSFFDTRSIGLIESFKRNTKVGLLLFHLTADR